MPDVAVETDINCNASRAWTSSTVRRPAVFNAVLQRKDPKLPVYVVVPHAMVAGWNLKATTMVEGSVNGRPMGRRSMKRWDATAQSNWFIEYTAPFCKEAGIAVGDELAISLRPATADLPDELCSLLQGSAELRAAWKSLSDYARRASAEHIRAGKTAATRSRRAQALVAKLEASHQQGAVRPGPATTGRHSSSETLMKMVLTTAATPDEYIACLSDWQRSYVAALRTAVASAAPELEEHLKWGHIVYFRNGPVLLIRAEPSRVLLGFWRGQRLRHIEPRLKPGGKHEMATLELKQGTPLDRSTVLGLAKQAASLGGAGTASPNKAKRAANDAA